MKVLHKTRMVQNSFLRNSGFLLKKQEVVCFFFFLEKKVSLWLWSPNNADIYHRDLFACIGEAGAACLVEQGSHVE